jgi:2-oxoglutarate ferredoxin oxidoreductase subunit gamma
MIQVRFAGLGGQGILLMGEILGEAAVMEKKYVGQTASYGAEARGSATRSDVVISDSWIDYPEVTEADILACMSQNVYEQYKGKINRQNALIFIDSQMVKPDPAVSARHITVPAVEKALKELGNRMVANMILLGVVTQFSRLAGEDSMLKALANRVPAAFLELNRKALMMGFEMGKEFQNKGG